MKKEIHITLCFYMAIGKVNLHETSYLENLSDRLLTDIELWLKTGIIAPRTTSLLERVFRETGRRLKRIAWGWSDEAVKNMSKMIMIRDNFNIEISSVNLSPGTHF